MFSKIYSKKAAKYINAFVTGDLMLRSYSGLSVKERNTINKGRLFTTDKYTLKAMKHITLGDIYKDPSFSELSENDLISVTSDLEKSLKLYK